MGVNRFIRTDAARNAIFGYRVSVATHSRDRFTPPPAGFFYAVASLRFFADIPYRHAKRAWSRRKIIPVK